MRLAGVDAPEMARFGSEGQKYAREARQWLNKLVFRKPVTVHVHGFDHYNRAIGTVFLRRRIPFWPRNVSLELAKAGYAVVYKGAGAQYGGFFKRYLAAERSARLAKRGMWKLGDKLVLPGEYRKALRAGGFTPSSAVASRKKMNDFLERNQWVRGLRTAYNFFRSLR